MRAILSPAEQDAYLAFISATNEVGGLEGYERMLAPVLEALVLDHGEPAAIRLIQRLLPAVEGAR